jgi:hypothetical protein
MRTFTCMPREPLGFGPAAKSHLFEKRSHFESHAAHVVLADARTGVEVNAQLVGMVEIAGAHGVRMQLDAAQVYDPREPRWVIDDNFLRFAS